MRINTVFKSLFLLFLLTTVSCSNKRALPPQKVMGFSSTRIFDRGLITLCSPKVKFAWNANPESNIAGYKLKAKNTDNNTEMETDVGNSVTGFYTLYPGNWSITVRAYNTAGLHSDPSDPLLIKVEECGTNPPPDENDPNAPLPDSSIVTSNVTFVTDNTYQKNITHIKATFTSKAISSNTTLCPGQVFQVEGSPDLTNWTAVGPLLVTPFPATEVTAPTGGAEKYFLRLRKTPLEDGSDEPAKFEPNCGQTSYNYPPADGDSLASNENSMSADGNTLVFSSKATVYSNNDPKGANSDIFLKNLVSGQVTRVSTNSDYALEAACVGTCVSEDARISGNGRFVAFSSSRTDLGAYPTNDTKFIAVDKYRSLILYDKINKTHKLVSIESDGVAPLVGRNSNASISDDGRWVVFMNNIDNYRIYIKDMLDDGVGPDGSGGPLLRIGSNNNDRQPKMDRNGNFVVFASGFHTTGGGIYIWRRSDNRTQLVSDNGGFYSYGIASSGTFIDHTVFPGNRATMRLSQLRDAASSPNSILGTALREVSYANSPGGAWPDESRFQSTRFNFSDDGTKALYRGTDAAGRGTGHYLFDIVNNTHTALPLLPAEYQTSVQNPTLSANAKKAVFSSRPDSAGHSSGYQIFLYDLESISLNSVTGASIAPPPPPPPNEEVAMTVGYYDSMEIDPTKNYTLTYSGEGSEMIFRINGESVLQTFIMGNQLVQIPMRGGWDCNYDGSICSGPNGANITFENFDSNTLTTYVKFTQ